MRGFNFRYVTHWGLLTLFAAMFSLAEGYGQSSFERLFELYSARQLNELKKAVDAPQYIKLKNKPEMQFFNALFLTDAEAALAVYKKVFRSGEGRIKYLAAEKLYQYFYAKGFYVKAQNYQKYLVEHQQQNRTSEPSLIHKDEQASEKISFYIQVGAFGIKENAEQRRRFLQTQDISSSLVKRKVGNKTLFCIWIKGKEDLEATMRYAERLKKKFDLDYQIMKK